MWYSMGTSFLLAASKSTARRVIRPSFFIFCYLFNFWLCWVFLAFCGLSQLQQAKWRLLFSFQWLLLWQNRLGCSGFSSCSTRAQKLCMSLVALCSYEIFLNQESNPYLLHWQADSYLLGHEGNPDIFFLPPPSALNESQGPGLHVRALGGLTVLVKDGHYWNSYERAFRLHYSRSSCLWPEHRKWISRKKWKLNFQAHQIPGLFIRPTGPAGELIGRFSSLQLLTHVRLFATPWIAARQASLSITNSRSLPKLMSIVLVMPSNHLILCHALLLLPSIFPSIRVFSNESALCIRWPKYWSFSFSISPSTEHPGLISFRMD